MVPQKLLDVFNSKYYEKRRLTLEERLEEVVEEFGSRYALKATNCGSLDQITELLISYVSSTWPAEWLDQEIATMAGMVELVLSLSVLMSMIFSSTAQSSTLANNEIIIFATIGLSNTSTTVNHVWQDGAVSGNATQIHGVLNAVSWGILMPIGALIARYLKAFKSADPAWFYLHVGCQSIAYIVGVAGWGTGLKLGSESTSIQYDAHRTIGIILFCLGTLQVFALLLRPKPDHKYRFYWNIYHHLVGYSVIILSIINIFKGFSILNPDKKWKNAYIGVIAALAFNAVWLEGYTWYLVVKRKRSEIAGKMPHGMNGSNGVNGFGARQHQGV
ncbi:hypothetical protein D5086_028675 [Populus alba]|uniref:Uncharacterized protein n=1 Tax=Populus alba TaxID=43335 RepID=A0ACC4ARG6_POPAL